ncbi:nucleoside-diphosphate sugar epimerase [Paenibacillus taiwanensis]|uniref:nucleoside-diphosphate sugar epimerase n=1 Tax=Paenibacillus taiwanensis TaxID=401638 RepID=UPI0003F9CCDA|nr:nucleoside-diphosphate sugar epimerase [Paenibacillus taiwanensis]
MHPINNESVHQAVNETIQHLSHTQQQLARVLDAERHVAVRNAQAVHVMPDTQVLLEGAKGIKEQSMALSRNLIAYLNGIADLEHALTDQLEQIMIELQNENEQGEV